MKKIKKTKEEKVEIKKYKKEQKELRKKNKVKIKLKREHLYLIMAVIVLIILIAILSYYIFFNKAKKIIVPDVPSYETLEVGITNYNGNNASSSDLNNISTENLSVSYNIISDYYENDILLSNTQVFYLNESFMITSGPLSEDSFISNVSKDGDLKWINRLSSKEYDDIKVYKVVFLDDNYYVIGIAKIEDTNNIIVLKVNQKGTIVTSLIVAENIDTKVKDALVNDNNIAIITNDGTDINIYFTDADLNKKENVVNINDLISDEKSLSYSNGTFDNNIVSIISSTSDEYYITTINTDNYEANTSELSIDNEIDSTSLSISGYLKGFVVNSNNKLYKYDSNNKLINTYDYNDITLEDLTEYKEQYKDNEYIDVEDTENSIYIESINITNGNIVVNSRTLLSYIYDIYDENLNLDKRVTIDILKYSYDEGVKLNSFYSDGVIYEVYSYGTDTPSIMISKIG